MFVWCVEIALKVYGNAVMGCRGGSVIGFDVCNGMKLKNLFLRFLKLNYFSVCECDLFLCLVCDILVVCDEDDCLALFV